MSDFDSSKILLSTTIAGVAGNVANCGTDGATGCVTTAAFPAADVSNRNGSIVEWSIVQGVTIGGKVGAASVSSLLPTGAHRDRTSSQMTYAQELSLGANTIFQTLAGGTGLGYREVPLIAKDDDGYIGSGNPAVNLTRPTVGTWGGLTSDTRKVCGKSATTVATKIINCETHNANATPWIGSTNGISGEGSWTLVTVYSATGGLNDGSTCDNACYEVWRDDRTGMLWSDTLNNGTTSHFNWCAASGNSNATGVAAVYREVDPFNTCDNATYQHQTNPYSLCFEDTGFTTSTLLDPMKGNMHKHGGATAAVKWRLPTIHDYETAAHNGIRRVLPNMIDIFWSST